jgi:hypothetical protein
LRRRRARRTRIGATHALRDDEKGEGAGGCAPRGPLQSPAAAAGQSFPPPLETSTPSLTLPAATSIIYTRGERSHRRRHEHDRCKPAYDASPHVEGCRHTPQQPSDIGSYGWWPRRSGALLSVNQRELESLCVGGATMSTPWRWLRVGEGEKTGLVFCTHALMMDQARSCVWTLPRPSRGIHASSAPGLLKPVGTFCSIGNILVTYYNIIILI